MGNVQNTAAAATIPLLSRPRNFQWYWNSSVDPWAEGDAASSWMKYTDVENEIIEDAYQAKKEEAEIDGDCIVNIKDRLQYRKLDTDKRRPIKRVVLAADRSNVHLREERFSLPITVTSVADDHFSLKKLGLYGPDFCGTYYSKVIAVADPKLVVADILEEAAAGILVEGRNIGKRHEAEWLAEQLRLVKPFGYIPASANLPKEIGATCVFLYTKESFLYKLLNSVLRSPDNVTREQLKTLGPFAYLLSQYLLSSRTTNIKTVYRGMPLTDEQRRPFMKASGPITFSAFTSTSGNRKKAEEFGDTLLVIDLDRKFSAYHNENIPCGADVSSLSNFANEEEFLLWPTTAFAFDRYEYDGKNSKHIIYLHSYSSQTDK